ncbi:AtpZ/AtpI family protein [Dyadobacter sp. CY356]|uniref:AtpZ/AtpI family protein n=1 Tax=Dyadobacter sp. CY356 TaxID=2906442 RepID=UPI001F2FA718|nr:AtpZ/AtpI family protein [Dyadobacter sp. CY356]MCF0057333.1 AtpZ/AtpI family protein [Dyadobacter sp. CY356]
MPFTKFEATLPINSTKSNMEADKNERKNREDTPFTSMGNSGKTPSNFIRYSGMAMQTLGTILVFTYAGYKLDAWQMNKMPVWTLVLSLTSIAASLYLLIRSMPKLK